MTSLLDLIFPKRSNPEMAQAAHDWQRQHPPSPGQPPDPPVRVDLAKLPGYEPGMYAQRYHRHIEIAIQAAMSPDISKMATLPANNLAKNNHATPTPETREALFQDVPNVSESLVLCEPDEEATERRTITRRDPRNTINIPAMPAEMLLLEIMRKPAHNKREQSTNENEWML